LARLFPKIGRHVTTINIVGTMWVPSTCVLYCNVHWKLIMK
jgi:hypothetical protein